MPESRPGATAVICVALLVLGTACSGDTDAEPASSSQPTAEATTTTTAAAETTVASTTTTTAPRPPLAERAFPPLDGLQYAELPPDEITLFAGAVDANADSDVVTGVDARAVGNPGEPLGVLVAYDLGPAFADPRAWLEFASGVAQAAGGDVSPIEVDGTAATLVVDVGADTVGILWRADEGLALLALGSDGTEAFSVASARVAAG